jgi:hypothetical protein
VHRIIHVMRSVRLCGILVVGWRIKRKGRGADSAYWRAARVLCGEGGGARHPRRVGSGAFEIRPSRTPPRSGDLARRPQRQLQHASSSVDGPEQSQAREGQRDYAELSKMIAVVSSAPRHRNSGRSLSRSGAGRRALAVPQRGRAMALRGRLPRQHHAPRDGPLTWAIRSGRSSPTEVGQPCLSSAWGSGCPSPTSLPCSARGGR